MAKCSMDRRIEGIKRHLQPAWIAGFFTFEIFESEIWIWKIMNDLYKQ